MSAVRSSTRGGPGTAGAATGWRAAQPVAITRATTTSSSRRPAMMAQEYRRGTSSDAMRNRVPKARFLAALGPPHRREIHAAAQQKARLLATVRRGDVEHQRMEQEDVASRAGILDHLQRDAAMLLRAVHETSRAFGDVAFGMQVTNIGMILQELAILGTACARRWRMVLE